MKLVHGADNYRQLLASIATNNMSVDRLLEVSEQALLSVVDQIYELNEEKLDEVGSDIAFVYTMLVQARLEYQKHYNTKPSIKLVK